MAAIAANVFGVTTAALDETDKVSGKQTDRRVFGNVKTRILAQKRVPASAGIFGRVVTLRYFVNAVTEHIAQIPHPFSELPPARIRVVRKDEQKRVPAPAADVFTMSSSLCQRSVMVTEQKT